jgi:hypothetical protein
VLYLVLVVVEAASQHGLICNPGFGLVIFDIGAVDSLGELELGCVQVPYHTGASITVGKQFYCFLQYSKYIKNGWSILETNHPDTTLAAVSPKHSKRQAVVLVVSNFDGKSEPPPPPSTSNIHQITGAKTASLFQSLLLLQLDARL